MSYLIIYHIMSCNVTSYHISYHVMSYLIIYHVMSYIISYHIKVILKHENKPNYLRGLEL